MRTTLIPRMALVAALVGLAADARADVSFNFNNQSDAGLTQYNPLSALGLGLGGTYSFPQLSAGNYGYQMQAPAVPQVGGLVGVGAIMGSFYAAQAFGDVNSSADFTRWVDSNNQVMVIASRAQFFADGTFSGYILEYVSKGLFTSGLLDIERIDHGVATGLGAFTNLTLDPTHTYRLLLQERGSNLTGQVVDVAQPGTILGTASATDSTYANGVIGIGVGASQNNAATIGSPVDATFDNFSIQSVPEPSSLVMAVVGLGLTGVATRRAVGRRKDLGSRP